MNSKAPVCQILPAPNMFALIPSRCLRRATGRDTSIGQSTVLVLQRQWVRFPPWAASHGAS